MSKKKDSNLLKKMKEDLVPKAKKKRSSSDFLSTGSTLLNLAISGTATGGWAKGCYYHFIGDSNSGKTFLCLTLFAEAIRNRNFEDYRLIYDPVENGAMMNFEKFFGKKLASRLEYPSTDEDGEPVASETIEEFYDSVDDAVKDGRPFIYVLDSHDSLSSSADEEKYEDQKEARRKDKEASGSYGDGKAKANSRYLRRLVNPLKRSGSILIIISQTRDNIGAMGHLNPKTVSGGRALKFYATLQLWAANVKKLTRKIRGKERQIGIMTKISIKKNRIEGKERSIEVPILHSYGVDDIGSCIDFMVGEGFWKKGKEGINVPDLELKGSRAELIREIEEKNLESEMQMLVAEAWTQIENECKEVRKKRYE